MTWSDGNSKFTRTVSNSTPSVGETVAVSTKFERTGGAVEWIQAVKDLHPACLTYVSGNTSGPEVAADYTRVTGNWPVYPNISPKSQTFTFNYLVNASCARATPLMTTMHYGGSLGSGTYSDKGPTITVAKDATTTTLSAVPTPMLTGQSVTLTGSVTGAGQGSTIEFYDGTTKLGQGLSNASGVATYAWTPTTAGARSLTAKFPGTVIANSSQSAAQNVQVNAPVTTGVSVSVPATAVAGAPVTLSASLTPSNAAGTVQFKDNGANIGSPVSVAGGQATLPHTFTTTGAHSITADFVAGSGFVNSSASAQTVTVNASTSTTLQVPASASTGTPVTLSASVTPANAAGAVQFKDNGTAIGSPVAVAAGQASVQHTFGAAGSHDITAEFIAGPGFASSAAAPQSVAVSNPDVTTSLSLSLPGSATTGSSVDLTATVSPSNAQGTVQFTDNGSPIGSPVPVTNGSAMLPHTFTGAGSHSVAANFVAGPGFVNSSAAAQTVTVSDPDVTTSLSVTAPGSAETGESVSLSATVSPSNAQGAVQFKVGGVAVGSPVTVTGGVASVPHTFDAAGSFVVTAEFTGAAGFVNSSATAQTVTVSDPDVTTSLSVTAPGSAETGESVSLSATVSPSNAQGSVQFKVNGNPVGAPQAVSGGSASLSHTFNAAGSFAVTAEFIGAAGFTNSSASAQTVAVTDPDVLTSMTVQVPGSATTGSSVDLSATVSPSNAVGTVQFTDNGAPIGSPVAVVNGVATLPHTFTGTGSHSIGALFTGGSGFADVSANAPGSITVADPDVETSLSVTAPAAAATGQSVSLSATVTPPGAQGSVQFKVNGAPVGASQAVSGGTVTLPYTFNAADTYAVTAEFTGAAGFTNSTASAQNVTVSVPVVPDENTTTTVTAPTTAETGQQVTLSAAVSPVPTAGTVQFKVAGVDVGVPVAVDGSGHAGMQYTFNVAGPFAVSAVYSGTTGFAGSTAPVQNVTVSDPAPVDVVTSTLVGAPGSATTGVETTLSATVQAQSGTAVPTGSVQFRDNGSPIGSPVALVNGSASLGHTFTAAGTHQVSAVYTADAGFEGSTSTQRPVVVSAPNPSDVVSSVVVSSAQSATAGTSFTLKAQVIGAPSLPGTVQFFDGGVEIGGPVPVVNGVAELVHTFTSDGPHQIHAVYSGGTGVAGSTSPIQVLDVVDSGGGTGGSGSMDFGSLGSLSGFRLGA
ncbi:Ig-like domain-containing protein [Rhodococcus sp. OK519]|uniref:beta strand repeat-containing protein n=1 Tax=Rhodococcus sp. OK519 TaxID=2135729 RepID=UPI002158D544